MTDEASERRHSKALEPELISDPTLKAEAEAANGRLEVSKMEALVEALLAKQLARVYELAAGKTA